MNMEQRFAKPPKIKPSQEIPLTPLERTTEGETELTGRVEMIRSYANFLEQTFQGMQRDMGIRERAKLAEVEDADHFAPLTTSLQEMLEFVRGIEVDASSMNKKLEERLTFVSKDLLATIDAAVQLKNFIFETAVNCDRFNGENAQTEEYKESNVTFDRDGMNGAVAALEALIDASVRADIDIVMAMQGSNNPEIKKAA